MDAEALKESSSSPSFRPHASAQLLSLLGQLRRLIAKCLAMLLIIFPRSLKPANNKKLHSTAYLDALRGYAAWIVYNMHFIPKEWRADTDITLIRPFVHVWFQGRAMVDLFFVISGFALSYSVLGHMHNQQPTRVLESLASSVCRRHLRLYLPITWATFVAMLAISAGIAVKPTKPAVLQDTWLGNFWFWIKDTVRSCNPFPHVVSWWNKGVRVTHTDYLPQAWTIPVEFRGSLIVFLMCLAVCRMTPRARSWVILGGAGACYWWVTPYGGLFLFGMWLADRRQYHLHAASILRQRAAQGLPLEGSSRLVDVNEGASEDPARELLLKNQEKEGEGDDEDDAPQSSPYAGHARQWWSLQWLQLRKRWSPSTPSSYTTKPTLTQQLPYLLIFTFSLWPLTAPVSIDASSPFPYNLVAHTLPPSWTGSLGAFHWPYCVGAMLLCYALEHSPLLQAPLNWSFSQFLGELSFGIYVMHNLVRWSVWERFLVEWANLYLGEAPRWQVPGYLVVTVMVFWAAEAFRRVDVFCVRLTKRLQDFLFEC